MTPEFKAWPKIPRLRRDCTVTEKIDGTNACVIVTDEGVFAQSRKRLITPEIDNAGFARWVQEHEYELAEGLGEGYHYGEWYGSKIQRGYGLNHKRFALFNVERWGLQRPECCDVVPVIWRGNFTDLDTEEHLTELRQGGSWLVPGYKQAEGIVVCHNPSRMLFKVLLEGDDIPKGVAA